MRYWPLPSVTTERVFSIRASLAASTVTPGSTAPDVSFATPTIALCACAAAGSMTTHARAAAASPRILRLIRPPMYWSLTQYLLALSPPIRELRVPGRTTGNGLNPLPGAAMFRDGNKQGIDKKRSEAKGEETGSQRYISRKG